jgi:hypothetical protein
VLVRYRKNNGISSEVARITIVTLWIKVDQVNSCWKQWTVVEHDPRWGSVQQLVITTFIHKCKGNGKGHPITGHEGPTGGVEV